MKMMNETELLNVLATNVGIYRKNKGITQEELSKMLGKNSSYIERLENFKFKKIPSLDVVYNLTVILEVTFNNLLEERNIEK